MANEDVEKEKRELELQRQKRFSGGPGSRFISGGEQASRICLEILRDQYGFGG